MFHVERRYMKKIKFTEKMIMLVALLLLIGVGVSATSVFNYVYNESTWVPMLSEPDGTQKIAIEMKNCSYGWVQNDLNVGGIITGDGSGLTGVTVSNASWNFTGTNVFLARPGNDVGIGTITPTHELNVVGNLNITGDIWSQGINISRNWTLATFNTWGAIWSGLFRTDGRVVYNLTANFSIGTATSDYRFQTIGNVNLSNTLFVSGTDGFVGIGTATPTHKLTVVGNVNITGNLNITGNIHLNNNITLAKEGNIDIWFY